MKKHYGTMKLPSFEKIDNQIKSKNLNINKELEKRISEKINNKGRPGHRINDKMKKH